MLEESVTLLTTWELKTDSHKEGKLPARRGWKCAREVKVPGEEPDKPNSSTESCKFIACCHSALLQSSALGRLRQEGQEFKADLG